jgi:CHRD domain
MRDRAFKFGATIAATVATFTVAAVFATAAGGDAGGRPFRLALSGAEEFNAAGEPINTHGNADRGSVVLILNQGQEEVCWRFGAITLTQGDVLPHVAHIHRAEPGFAGPVVVDLFGGSAAAPAPTAYSTGTTCVPASAETIKAIRAHPEDYYINLHNAQHPGGVMRAQLG